MQYSNAGRVMLGSSNVRRSVEEEADGRSGTTYDARSEKSPCSRVEKKDDWTRRMRWSLYNRPKAVREMS